MKHEWRQARGVDCLVDERGEIRAKIHPNTEGLYVARYGNNPSKEFISSEAARREMVRLYDDGTALEAAAALDKLAKKAAAKKPKEKS